MPLTSKIRQLFQALSVSSAIACMLLILLWVRSYWWYDSVSWRPFSSRQFFVMSHLGVSPFVSVSAPLASRWEYSSRRAELVPSSVRIPSHGFYFQRLQGGFLTSVPHWFLVFVTATFTVTPWIYRRPHFSLRTLLVGTTLVAVVLGVIAWAAR